MRTQRFTVADLLAEARATLLRLTPTQAAAAQHAGALLLDTRTEADRLSEGVIPGSVHMPLSTIQWLVDPAPGYQHPVIHGFDQHLVVVCNEGYSSSLAAASLKRLGFVNATDLDGGYRMWKIQGFPTVPVAANVAMQPVQGTRRRTVKSRLYQLFMRVFQ